MKEKDSLKNLTEYLVKELLPNDVDVKIELIETENDIVIRVLVPTEYMSSIIGKGGNIANSIRTIVQAAAYNNKFGRTRINIDSL